jgi:tetratricopeptide (TPR) repeat protein
LLIANGAVAAGLPEVPSQLLLSSYTDLAGATPAPRHAENVILTYEEYRSGTTAIHLRRYPIGTIRLLLQSEWPQERVGAYDPREIPEDHRSARWDELCDGLEAFRNAALKEQTALLGMCSALGYYRLTADLGIDLVNDIAAGRERLDDDRSRLFLVITGSAVRLMPAQTCRPLVEMLLRTVRERGTRSMRLLAQANLVAYLSWSGTCQETASEADVLVRELHARLSADTADEALTAVLATLACGWAFARNGNSTQAREHVDEAWEKTRELDPDSDATVAHVARSITEARVALSVRAGDSGRAIDEHRAIVDADPLDAQAWAERGALMEATDHEQALVWYRQAARLGAPMTEYVYERMGDLLVRTGDMVGAYDAYASATASGAGRGRALSKLAKSAVDIGQHQIARWAQEQLAARTSRHPDHTRKPLPVGASVGAFPPSPVLDIPSWGSGIGQEP